MAVGSFAIGMAIAGWLSGKSEGLARQVLSDRHDKIRCRCFKVSSVKKVDLLAFPWISIVKRPSWFSAGVWSFIFFVGWHMTHRHGQSGVALAILFGVLLVVYSVVADLLSAESTAIAKELRQTYTGKMPTQQKPCRADHVVVVFDLIGGYGVTREAGAVVHDAIAQAIAGGQIVRVDFQGVTIFTASFFEAAIAPLFHEFEALPKKLTYVNLSATGVETWLAVRDLLVD